MRERMAATGIYGIVHFLVDFGCAFLIFRVLSDKEGIYQYFFLYNFCAFALQMPVGVLADRKGRNPQTAALGCFLIVLAYIASGVMAGAGSAGEFFCAVPVVLAGMGNCLFHVGGGIEILNQGGDRLWPLGIFISPGAAGIFLGTQLGKGKALSFWIPCLALVAGGLLPLLRKGKQQKQNSWADEAGRTGLLSGALLCLFLVVVLRSHLGMVFRFPWKSEMAGGLLALAGVVLGKAAGGIAADQFGIGRTAFVSMLASVFCFFFAKSVIPGVLGLFFFNMSMPLTLYLAAAILGKGKGFAFGLLTFALFVGFLPAYLGYGEGSALGLGILGVVSLILLSLGWKLADRYLREAGNE